MLPVGLLITAGEARADAVTILPATLPSQRYWTSAIWDGTNAYIFGGISGNTFLDQIIKYNPATGAVSTMSARLPSPRAATSAVWDGTNAYIIGGEEGFSTGTLAEIVRYNPASDTATRISAVLPSPRLGTSAVWDGSNIYVFGGLQNGCCLFDTIVRYNPSTNAISNMNARLPHRTWGSGAIWDGTNAYILGGDCCSQGLYQISRYNPASDTVTEMGVTLPAGARGYNDMGVVWDGTSAYVFGGCCDSDGHRNDEIARYTPSSNTVALLETRLPRGNRMLSAVWASSSALLFGGELEGTGQTNQIARFGASANLVTSTLDSTPHPFGMPAANTLGWTTTGPNMGQFQGNLDPAISIAVNMGEFAGKAMVQSATGYRLTLGMKVEGTQTNDPCHVGPFDLFALRVNGVDVNTVRGIDERSCRPNEPRIFDIEPTIPGQDANVFTVPTSAVHSGTNIVEIQPLDSGYPNTPTATRGWRVMIDWVELELVAPPTVILHGWDPSLGHGNWQPQPAACGKYPGTTQWQCDFKDSMIATASDAFGQNPWAWDGDSGQKAIITFGYNGKQGINRTVSDLQDALASDLQELAWTGEPNLIGHSMGGLVAKAFVVAESANLPTPVTPSRVVTIATPHAGTKMADFYTCALVDVLGDSPYVRLNHNSRRLATPMLLSSTDEGCNWSDYYAEGGQNNVIGAFRYPISCRDADGACIEATQRLGCGNAEDEPCIAFPNDRLADFQLKRDGPTVGTPNSFIAWLEASYLTAERGDTTRLLAIAGNCGGAQDPDARCTVPIDIGTFRIKPDFSTGVFGTPNHDLIVPVESARDAGSGHSWAICTGDNYSHLSIMNQPAVVALAVQAPGLAWADSSLQQIVSAGNCVGSI